MQDDTKQRLLDSAGQIFSEKGFKAASIREICQSAGANIAAVHYYFGDKQQLYVAAVRAAQCAQVDHIPLPELPPELPPEERLQLFIRTLFLRMLDPNRPKWHLQLMLRELAHPSEVCHAIVQDYIRPLVNTLQAIIAELVPTVTEPQTLWRIGFSIMGQVLFHYVHRPVVELLLGEEVYELMTVDVLAAHVTQFSLAAIGRAPNITLQVRHDSA